MLSNATSTTIWQTRKVFLNFHRECTPKGARRGAALLRPQAPADAMQRECKSRFGIYSYEKRYERNLLVRQCVVVGAYRCVCPMPDASRLCSCGKRATTQDRPYSDVITMSRDSSHTCSVLGASTLVGNECTPMSIRSQQTETLHWQPRLSPAKNLKTHPKGYAPRHAYERVFPAIAH